MHETFDNSDVTVRLVSGAVWDFFLHISNRPDPMIVGEGYPDEKLRDEFLAWSKKRKMRVDRVDLELWKHIAETGALE